MKKAQCSRQAYMNIRALIEELADEESFPELSHFPAMLLVYDFLLALGFGRDELLDVLPSEAITYIASIVGMEESANEPA